MKYIIILLYIQLYYNISCIKGCKKCFSTKIDSCYELEDSFYFENNLIKACNLENCKSCFNDIILNYSNSEPILNKNNDCYECMDNTTPVYDNNKIIECKNYDNIKLFKECKDCKIFSDCKNCSNCKNKENCRHCFECSNCEFCRFNIKRNINNCSVYNFENDICQVCNKGYILDIYKNNCKLYIKKDNNIENCELSLDLKTCLKPKDGYFLDKLTNNITKCKDINCSNCFENKDICSICKDGFYLNLEKENKKENYKCKKCDKSCALCAGLDSKNCTKCFIGYNLHIKYTDFDSFNRDDKSKILHNDYPDLLPMTFLLNHILTHLPKHECKITKCTEGEIFYGICRKEHHDKEIWDKKHKEKNLEEIDSENDFNVNLNKEEILKNIKHTEIIENFD